MTPTTRTDRKTRTNRTRTPRAVLRREAPSTIGLLADAEDFAAMGRYRSFAFRDHHGYLRQVDGLLRAFAAQGVHTTVALFDPERYAEYCSESGLDPDNPASRSRFTADVAARGATVTYCGQPIDELALEVVDAVAREVTWEYTGSLLAGLGSCADCGTDIGGAAFDRAARLLQRLLQTAGPGTHHLVCSVPVEADQLLAVLHTERTSEGQTGVDEREVTEFVGVLAVGLARAGSGGLVLRTTEPDRPDQLRGWRLHHGRLDPLTTAEVFSAYCTEAGTGEPLSPEPGAEYRPGFPVDDPDPHIH